MAADLILPPFFLPLFPNGFLNESFHISGDGGLESHGGPGKGMGQGDAPGVKHLAFGAFDLRPAAAVDLIAQNRDPDGG